MKERRTFSPEFKVRVVLELISGKKGLMEASREYGIKDTVLSRWKQEFLELALQLFQGLQTGHQGERITELERLVERLMLQLDMAKKVLGYSPAFPPRKTNDRARAESVLRLLDPGRLPVGGPGEKQLLLSQPSSG